MFSLANKKWEGAIATIPMLISVMYPSFAEALPILEIELPPDIKDFLDWYAKNQDEVFSNSHQSLMGGSSPSPIYNTTITHGDFRLENLFFEKEGKNGAPKGAAFIDFQLMHCGERWGLSSRPRLLIQGVDIPSL